MVLLKLVEKLGWQAKDHQQRVLERSIDLGRRLKGIGRDVGRRTCCFSCEGGTPLGGTHSRGHNVWTVDWGRG